MLDQTKSRNRRIAFDPTRAGSQDLLVRIAWRLVIIFLAVFARNVGAQEAIRSANAARNAEQHRSQLPPSAYTFKVRDLRVIVSSSVGLEWNDNVNISRTTDQQDDFILRPSVGVAASYPISAHNILRLNVTAGYQKYLQHDSLDSWFVQGGSDTELALDAEIKDFSINVHERPSYTQDSSQESSIAGTGSYGNFQNTAGVLVTWNLNDVTASLGYDHQNVFSTASQFNSQDHSSELLHGQIGFRLHPQLQAGFEASAAFTSYDQMTLNDNANYSAGVFADWHPGQYLTIQPRAGYTITQFQNTSTNIQTSDLNSWYADLNISHAITEAITYSLSAGHEIRLGIQSDAIETWYVRPNINLAIIKDLTFNTSFSYEHGKQGVGNIAGNLTETYDWVGMGFNTSYRLMKKLSVALNYRLTLRSSNTASRNYTQNVVGLVFSYMP